MENLDNNKKDSLELMSDSWMVWFSKLVDNLLGDKNGPYLDNFESSNMLKALDSYLELRKNFLSDHAYIVDNNKNI